jgi:endonuclease III
MTTSLQQLKKSTLYSEELGINLADNTDKELFKWFLASILYGARISETIAKHTYQTFKRYHLLTPQKIRHAGWDYLVDPIMREGGYVRYDGKTSSTLLQICESLLEEYNGSLLTLHKKAHDQQDLEARLECFYGIGPTTVNIFLRELRPYWTKSDPEPLPLVKEAASSLGIDLAQFRRKTITFTRIEAGLIRLRKEIKKHGG